MSLKLCWCVWEWEPVKPVLVLDSSLSECCFFSVDTFGKLEDNQLPTTTSFQLILFVCTSDKLEGSQLLPEVFFLLIMSVCCGLSLFSVFNHICFDCCVWFILHSVILGTDISTLKTFVTSCLLLLFVCLPVTVCYIVTISARVLWVRVICVVAVSFKDMYYY